MRQWAEYDLAGVLEGVAEYFSSSKKVLLVGHSAGGQLLGLCANNRLVAAMLAVASQSGYWPLWPAPRRFLLATLWYVWMPVLTRAVSYFPARRLGLGENLPPGVALEWARWCRSPDYVVDDLGKPLREHFEQFRGSILAYSFDDDSMAPRAAVESLMSFYSNTEVEMRYVRPADVGVARIGHFGFFSEKFKDTLWLDSLEWLTQQ